MAVKPTPINQEVVLNLKAKTNNIEASIKTLIQKLQGTTLSDSFTKSYVTSLQKVLDKSQELRKVISETNTVNSKTTADWTSSYNKISNELTRMISKLENSSIDFRDLTGYDEAQFKKLKEDLKRVEQLQKEIYSTKNVATKTNVSLSKEIDSRGNVNKAILSSLDNEEKVNAILDSQVIKIQRSGEAAQAQLNAISQQITQYQELNNLINTLESSQTRLTNAQKQAAAGLGVTATTKKDTLSALVEKAGGIDETALKSQEAEATAALSKVNSQLQEIASYRAEVMAVAQDLSNEFQKAAQPIIEATTALENFKQKEVEAANVDLSDITNETQNVKTGVQDLTDETEKYTETLQASETKQSFFSDIQSKITQLFGLANAFQLLRRFVTEAWAAIEELDAAFTKIAVVTEYSTNDLWESFDDYNTMAQQLGVTTVDAIETSALYYQQGLETADVMTLTTETIKMAQIANMDFTEATQAMTAAIRGFKLEMQDANLVTDIYSALAAEAAVDTQDLATAISKTASIAGSAGLSLENTSAFLTQIIETTQEAAETAGTALKTIIARFSELKENPASLTVEVEGEEVSANKVEEALKTADVALRDTQGNFRDLDDVFLDLSSKWDSLDRNTQRYIATVAAGSRQQSRFIAMMDDYDRTLELVDIANNSAGASAVQFAKTLDSVSSKVNRLKSNFEALIGNLVENETVKAFLAILNDGLSFLVEVSEKGLTAFAVMVVTLGVTVKNALKLIVGTFSNVAKKWDETKAKIAQRIITPVVFDIDEASLAQVNAVREQLGQPIITRVTTAETGATGTGAVDTTVQTAATSVKKSLMSSAASGIASGLLIGVSTGNWIMAFGTALISTATSALSNPAVTKAISGSAIGGLAKTIGSSIVTALPYVAIAAGVVAVGYALYKWLDPLQKAEREVTNIKKEIEEMDETLQQSQAIFLAQKEILSSLADDINEYKDLSSAVSLTADEQDRLNELSNELANQFPELISGYDDAGNAILNQAADWEKIVALQKESTNLAKQQYAQDTLTSAYLEDALTDAEHAAAEERVKKWEEGQQRVDESIADGGDGSGATAVINWLNQWTSGNTNWLGEESDALKEAQALIEDATAYEAAKQLSAIQITNAIKNVAASEISVLESAEGLNLTDQTSLFGQDYITSRVNEIRSFIEGVQDAESDAALKDLDAYKNLSSEAKIYLEQIGYASDITAQSLQDLDSDAIINKLTLVSSAVATDIFDSLKELENKYSDEITSLMADSANITAQAFYERLEEILGEDNPLLSTIMTWFGETNDTLYNYLINSFGEKALGLTKEKIEEAGGTIGETIAQMAQDNGIEYLVGLGYDKTSAQAMVNDIQTFLDSQEYTYVVDVIGNANYTDMAQTYGADEAARGASYLQESGLEDEVSQVLSAADVSNVTGAQEAMAALINETELSYDDAKEAVLAYAKAVGQADNVNKDTISSFASLNSTLAKTRYIDKYSNALSNLKGDFLDLDEDGIQELIDEVPGAYEVLKKLELGMINGAEASEMLREAMMAQDIYETQEALQDVYDAYEDTGVASNEYQVALDALGISSDQFLESQGLLGYYLAGNTTGFWDCANAASALAGLTFGNLQDLDGNLLNNVASLEDASDSALNYAALMEALGLATIEEMTVDVPAPWSWSYGGETFSGINYVTKTIKVLKYKDSADTSGVRTNLNRYTSPTYTRSSGGGSSKENDYESDVSGYYNEINAIEDLKTALEKLTTQREDGGLSLNAYRTNLNQILTTYSQLQQKLHEYNNSLRADREALAQEINALGTDAIKVVNGELIVYRDKVLKLSNDTQEAIDEEIDKWEELEDTIAENSEQWMESQQKKIELLGEAEDAYISLEQRVIDILIAQDEEEIESTKDKYEAMKEADDEYLDALKDNIDKRRKARQKEEDYADLEKLETRLALLKRDTSGVYAEKILSLEEEIADARKELADQETDDMLEELEDQASDRADAYDSEVEELENLHQDKLDSMEEYNAEANSIMQSGYKQLMYWLMKNDDKYLTATDAAQKEYIDSWEDTINQASQLSTLLDVLGQRDIYQQVAHKEAEAAREYLRTTTTQNEELSGGTTYAAGAEQISSYDADGAYDWYMTYVRGRTDLTNEVKDAFWTIVAAKYKWEARDVPTFPGYSEGGLADFTGLAMVHGTTTNPEAFLSADDTKNFQLLAELLNNAINYKGNTVTEGTSSNRIDELNIIIETTIGSDYDVEQLIEKVKDEVLSSSNYNNMNLITRTR